LARLIIEPNNFFICLTTRRLLRNRRPYIIPSVAPNQIQTLLVTPPTVHPSLRSARIIIIWCYLVAKKGDGSFAPPEPHFVTTAYERPVSTSYCPVVLIPLTTDCATLTLIADGTGTPLLDGWDRSPSRVIRSFVSRRVELLKWIIYEMDCHWGESAKIAMIIT
jgi:hypothetical protein